MCVARSGASSCVRVRGCVCVCARAHSRKAGCSGWNTYSRSLGLFYRRTVGCAVFNVHCVGVCVCVHQAFSGNSNSESSVRHELQQGIVARFLRLVPLDWSEEGRIGLRMELYGCSYCES